MIIGASTEVHNGAHLIATAGGIDTHIHFICPQQAQHAIESGVTINWWWNRPCWWHSRDPWRRVHGIWNACSKRQKLYLSAWAFRQRKLFNVRSATWDKLKPGALGLKIHEDWGATPAVIDSALKWLMKWIFKWQFHTDTLNESGFLEDTMKAIDGRVIHTFHTEGGWRSCARYH